MLNILLGRLEIHIVLFIFFFFFHHHHPSNNGISSQTQHFEDYVRRDFKKIRSRRFRDRGKALKVQILNKVALTQVVRERISF